MEGASIAALHTPVMLAETLEALSPKPAGRYLDGTVGLGGHDEAILSAAPGSQICGLDRDGQALELARERLAPFGQRVHLFHMPFGDFPLALDELGWEKIDGALLDLGLSSFQLDTPERGFSFRAPGPIDMRMDAESGAKSAWHLVNRASHAQLRDIFVTLGEDPQAGRIARRIIEERQKEPINDTTHLADIIYRAYPPAWRRSAKRHPATRAFQALRMAVNDELGQLGRFLERLPDWLAPGGRVVIISFHSLEDRMVKQAMRSWAKGDDPLMALLAKKPLTPGQEEEAANPRSSSAKLRAAVRLDNDHQ